MSTQTPVGAVFADPAGLGGTLTRRARPTSPPATREQPAAPTSDPDATVDRVRDTTAKRGVKARTKRVGSDTIVYVTPQQAETVRHQRRATGRTVTEIVLAAVEQAAPKLDGAFTLATVAKPAGRLFLGSQPVGLPPEPDGRVQLCLRMVKSDRDALDALTAAVNAPSRSHLVRRALDLAFDD